MMKTGTLVAFFFLWCTIPVMGQRIDTVRVANIQDAIEGMPLGYNTKIGQEGQGVSQGQRQRLLIARAVYKDPTFLFFDEATNSLDANNERVIMDNQGSFVILWI